MKSKITHEEWLEERRKSIGGSDAAAVIGLNKYRTPLEVYFDKIGALPEQEDSEAMRIGRDLENYVAKRFTEATGKKVRKHTAMIHNPEYPFAHANIDRDIINESAGLECKFISSFSSAKRFTEEEFPEEYYCQCVHYLAVTGYERWYLAALIAGVGLKIYTIERNDEEIKALMEAESDFWNEYIVKEVAPEPRGTPNEDKAINELFNSDDSEETEPIILEGFAQKLKIRDDLTEQMKILETEKQRIEQEIKLGMGENQAAESGTYTITWKPHRRSIFSVESFKNSYPEIDLSKFFEQKEYRVLKIKKKEI